MRSQPLYFLYEHIQNERCIHNAGLYFPCLCTCWFEKENTHKHTLTHNMKMLYTLSSAYIAVFWMLFDPTFPKERVCVFICGFYNVRCDYKVTPYTTHIWVIHAGCVLISIGLVHVWCVSLGVGFWSISLPAEDAHGIRAKSGEEPLFIIPWKFNHQGGSANKFPGLNPTCFQPHSLPYWHN